MSMKELLSDLIMANHKECVECEGIFQRGEQICLDINNQSYCTSCYKDKESK